MNLRAQDPGLPTRVLYCIYPGMYPYRVNNTCPRKLAEVHLGYLAQGRAAWK